MDVDRDFGRRAARSFAGGGGAGYSPFGAMKKTTKPAVAEVAEYFSDFSGAKLQGSGPEARVHIEFSYGSAHDGSSLVFDLTDQEALQVVDFLGERLCSESKREVRAKLRKVDGGVEDSIQCRDWQDAERGYAEGALLRRLVGARKKRGRE